MRHFHLIPLLALCTCAAFSGCSSNNKGKLEGTHWSSLEISHEGQTIPAGTLRLEFKEDGKMAYATPVGYYTGDYSLGWGDNVTLQLDRELAGRKDHTESIVVNGDRMTVTDSDGTSAKFRLLAKE